MTTELLNAQRFITMLQDSDIRLRAFAIDKLDQVVGNHWTEMVDHLETIIGLSTSMDNVYKEKAALLASKVYFYMGEFESALTYALEAGVNYIVGEKSKYEEIMKYKCIEESIKLLSEGKEAPPKLLTVLQHIINSCIESKEFTQAVGIALETMQLDILIKVIKSTGNESQYILYALNLMRSGDYNCTYREKVYNAFYKMMLEAKNPDYYNITQCLYDLQDVKNLSLILCDMCRNNNYLNALQISFDLFQIQNIPLLFSLNMEISSLPPESVQGIESKIEILQKVLNGETPNRLLLNFLRHERQTNPGLFHHIKESLQISHSITHEATLWANSIINAGTNDNDTLKANLEWVSKASHWEKFSAASGLGIIHYRNTADIKAVLNPYITPSQIANSPYSAAGAYAALGLVNTGTYDTNLAKEFLQLLKDHKGEQMTYGCVLGLGMLCAGHPDPAIYEECKSILVSENSIKGDAAAIAIGLLFMGTGTDEVVRFIYEYACETQHEKVIRSICMAIACIETLQESKANPIIQMMINHSDAIIRYGGMYTIGHAYAGTGNQEQIKTLLHYSANDVDNDVRKAAVINIAYILLNTPEKLPSLISLLADSYNPYIRYGAAMALGIGCGGTRNKEAQSILIRMLDDHSGFTLQGVEIALAMVMIQPNHAIEPHLDTFVHFLDASIKSKADDNLLRFGAILSRGILEAGGMNCTIQLVHQNHVRMLPLIGMSLFSQFWYWFNNIMFISYFLEPTPILGITPEFKIPLDFKVISANKPSLYAYQPKFKKEEAKADQKVKTATLSLSMRSRKARGPNSPKKEEVSEEIKKEEAKKEELKEPEPLQEIKLNGSRVVYDQRSFIQPMMNCRYVAVKEVKYLLRANYMDGWY